MGSIFKLKLILLYSLNDGIQADGFNRGDYNANLYVPDFMHGHILQYLEGAKIEDTRPDFIVNNINTIYPNFVRPSEFKGMDLRNLLQVVKIYIALNYGLQTYPLMCLN